MPTFESLSPCLWFDSQAEEAAQYYTSIFPNSRIVAIARYVEAGKEIHGRPPGSVMTVDFELDGTRFTALNGGPVFQFSEAVSFQIHCRTQEDIDYFWEKLGAGGDPKAQQCGWVKDKFGLSWQVVPAQMAEIMTGKDAAGSNRAMDAMMKMKKLDIAALKRAAAG